MGPGREEQLGEELGAAASQGKGLEKIHGLGGSVCGALGEGWKGQGGLRERTKAALEMPFS